MTAGDTALALASVEQLVTLDPTNADFRHLYREVQRSDTRRAA
jgi:hypothetical protein